MNSRSLTKLVAKIIDDVRKKGDRTLAQYAKKFDRVVLSPRDFRVSKRDIQKSGSQLSSSLRRAIEACGRRIREFHWREKNIVAPSWTYIKNGVRLGQIMRPVNTVGIYIPGGRFSYPSTVLMTAIAARLAGVSRIVAVTPPARLTPEILFASKVAGIDEIYRVGGPASVAALAYGTKTIPKVEMIVGPGNALVTEAKRQVFGDVGIDLLAGPSELVVLADETAPSAYIAADMLAQAEHDPEARSILVSTSQRILNEVKKQVPNKFRKQCEFIVHRNIKKAVALVNDYAGEHVEVMVKKPQASLDGLKNAGTIFLNPYSPAAMGDYWAGPSHVLPTGRSARFGSGLSVMSFMKRSSIVDISRTAYKKGWGHAYQMAVSEGLFQHAHSIKIRTKKEL
jgi:histidinol dehydrogenase